MKNSETQKVTVHIRYKNEMTVCALADSLHTLNDAFYEFHKENRISLSESNEASPKVVSVSNGSLIVDVIVPISCTLIQILYDAISRKFDSKKEYTVQINSVKHRMNWTDKDCYQLSKAVLKEYSINKSTKSVSEFIDELSLSRPYKKSSIKAKIQNTKQLIIEQNISTSLSISPLKKYSKAHRVQFDKARKDLNI